MAAAAGKSAGKGKSSGKTTTMKAPGKSPISFRKGGLHQSTGTPAGQPIPAGKMQKALSGKLGPKAKKQALFAKNVLGQGQRTAAKNRKK